MKKYRTAFVNHDFDWFIRLSCCLEYPMSEARLTCTFSFKRAYVGQSSQTVETAKATGYNGVSFLNVSNSSNIFSVAKKCLFT